MDFARLFQMLGNRLVRSLVSKGVSAGVDYAARGGKTKAEMTPEERAQAAQGKATAKKARSMAKLARRIGR